MAHSREKAKGRRSGGRFASIPHAVMNHPDFPALSANAVRLLLEMARQYNGRNNGDLSAAWTLMRYRGFQSQTTLARALGELQDRGFIIRTREGRFINPGKRCALYAIAWHAIDECTGKQLEVRPTTTPPRSFTAEIIKMPSPETGATRSRNWSDEHQKQVKS